MKLICILSNYFIDKFFEIIYYKSLYIYRKTYIFKVKIYKMFMIRKNIKYLNIMIF